MKISWVRRFLEPDFTYDISTIKSSEAEHYRKFAGTYAVVILLGLTLFLTYDAAFFLYWSVAFVVFRAQWLVSLWNLPSQVGRLQLIWLVISLCLTLCVSVSIIIFFFSHQTENMLPLGLLSWSLMGISLLSTRTDDLLLCSCYTVFLLATLSTMPIFCLLQGIPLEHWLIVTSMTVLVMVSFVSLLRLTRTSRNELRMIRDAEVAKRNLQSLGQLTGGVAHDFNNLLTIIKGNLGLYRELGGVEDADKAILLSEVESATDRAAALTSQLLVYARNSALTPERVDMTEVIYALRPLIQRLLPATHRLSIIAPGQPLWVEVDEKKLSNVLLNLVTNARQAMENGGDISIQLESRPRPTSGRLASALSDGFYVVVGVWDKGSGIPDHLLHRVVEPYFTTKPMGQGTGLGLSMAMGFAEQSGGGLNIMSEEGVGTTVELWFPRSDVAETENSDV